MGGPRTLAVAMALLLSCASALAQQSDADAAALSLADRTTDHAEVGDDWQIFFETAVRTARPRYATALTHGTRLSLDVRLDAPLADHWRVVFSNRLDVNRSDAPAAAGGGIAADGDVNTLREAYVSWQPAPDRIADIGRINARQGVATGYNPTDYFRAGALRSVVSLDPASLRENRLGSGMLRGQALWNGGSLTALYSPRLAERPSSSPYGIDLGATNRRMRWLVALSERLSDSFSPQWLLGGGAGRSPQLGLNLSALLNDATVTYLEWSGGRSPSLAAEALKRADDSAFRSRLATGLTYTTPYRLTLTAEYQYNGAGLAEAEWNALRRGPPSAYAKYRALAAELQDPPTRGGVFLHAQWQDVLIPHLDLAAMLRQDAMDASRLYWLEAGYHWPGVDLTVQAQLASGGPGSTFGAAAERRAWQVVLRIYY